MMASTLTPAWIHHTALGCARADGHTGTEAYRVAREIVRKHHQTRNDWGFLILGTQVHEYTETTLTVNLIGLEAHTFPVAQEAQEQTRLMAELCLTGGHQINLHFDHGQIVEAWVVM